jgi:small subunit ribosomal protein S4
MQLREKQKVRMYYGISEKQFGLTFDRADRTAGVTGHLLLSLLETRLDNFVYKAGFAASRREARLLVSHGHIYLNGKRVNVASIAVRAGDVVSVAPSSRQMTRILSALENAKQRGVPEWISLRADAFEAELASMPTRSMVTTPINENLIVEYYSK